MMLRREKRIPLIATRHNRPWWLLVLWPLLCGAWLSASHDPNACLPAALQTATEVARDAGHHHDEHAHDEHHHGENHSNDVSATNRVLDVQNNTSQLESSHLEAHEDCASCSLISSSAADEALLFIASAAALFSPRWTRCDCISFPQRHARGFSTRGPPAVFA